MTGHTVRRYGAPALGLLVALVAIAIPAARSLTPTPAVAVRGAGIVPFPNVGSSARDFTLPLLQTEEPWIGADSLTLSDLRGRFVYLDVFGTWCGPCRDKYSTMPGIARAVEARGGTIVGLLLEDRAPDAARWFRENGGMAYPFAILDEQTVRQWRIMGAPMGFLISPDGRIERKCAGCGTEGHLVEDLPREIARLSR